MGYACVFAHASLIYLIQLFLPRSPHETCLHHIMVSTVWHVRILREFNFVDWRFFCVLWVLIFVIGKDWVFFIGINLAIFWMSRSNRADNIFISYLRACKRKIDKTTCECKTNQSVSRY